MPSWSGVKLTLESRSSAIADGYYNISSPGTYHDGSMVLEIKCEFDCCETKVSVCMTDHGYTPPDGHIFVKTWSENQGVLEALVKAGILQRTVLPPIEVNEYGSVAVLCKVMLP